MKVPKNIPDSHVWVQDSIEDENFPLNTSSAVIDSNIHLTIGFQSRNTNGSLNIDNQLNLNPCSSADKKKLGFVVAITSI